MPIAAFDDEGWEELWRRACDRDQAAWNSLCGRLENVAWKNINKFSNLSEDDRNDIFAVVFFRLFTHIRTIKRPDRLPGWVATTSRNESLQLLRRRGKLVPVEDVAEAVAGDASPDERVLATERHAAVRQALSLMTLQCRRLLSLWAAEASQAQITATLGMPSGSIGPTVGRCLDRLKRLLRNEQ